MKLNRKQQGFTLIELVIVIIILGVLSVIATPKLLSLSSEAQASSLQGITGAIASVNKLVHSQTQIIGIADKNECLGTCNNHPNWDNEIAYFYINISGTRLYVYNGYPLSPLTAPSDSMAANNYKEVMGLSDDDFVYGMGSNSSFAIVPKKYESKLAQILAGTFKCHVEYRSPTRSFNYSIQALTDNC
ncbi:prepilin-type N-terminal cleavage/methylation domain-containing protein [Shewanella woodyi]|uniref:Methylation site containing protein n=1 Tax=Shewanella woodyi (strain ATCC 51908 / MS32) TaxID=392500 RepID=B1KNP2_SHEWM|nr:prepilin-type N-terminal cleavage/methylation domain-containing protein [Shewanella woodyi]ACA87500.1 methylation site containing protein [Shewanella woodyi ATCC 51908]